MRCYCGNCRFLTGKLSSVIGRNFGDGRDGFSRRTCCRPFPHRGSRQFPGSFPGRIRQARTGANKTQDAAKRFITRENAPFGGCHFGRRRHCRRCQLGPDYFLLMSNVAIEAEQFENIRTKVFADSESAVRELAAGIADFIRQRQTEKRAAVLGLATGSTPVKLYQELIRLHREQGLSFKNVITFNLDEYYGLAPTHPESYRHFMEV